jgi:hypothetical protein
MNTSRTKAVVVGIAIAGGAALALTGPGLPALAFLSGGLHLEVTALSPATLVARGAAVDVPVDVDCNATQNTFVSVGVTEQVGSQTAAGSGSVQVACNGGHQRIMIRVAAGSGEAFSKGTAVATASIFGCNNTTCGSESSSAKIHIRK